MSRLRRRGRIFAGVSVVLLAASCHVVAAAERERAAGQPLAGLDRDTLARIACIAPHRVAADDFTEVGADTVLVRCQTRGRINGFRTRFLAGCSNIAAQWRCDPAEFALVVPIDGRSVDLVIHGRISATRAVAVLRHAARVSHFGVEDTTGWVRDVCRLGALDAATWQLECGPARMQIAEDCERNRCRLRLFLAEKVVSSTGRPSVDQETTE